LRATITSDGRVIFTKVEHILRQLKASHDLAQASREARVQKLVEQRIFVIKCDIIAQFRCFLYKSKEAYDEMAAFRNDGEAGLVELGEKVGSEGEQVPWILVDK
jgi:hypothetical protein